MSANSFSPAQTSGRWTDEEDDQLRFHYYKQLNISSNNLGTSWSKIHDKIPWRTAKQIRERWTNHLDPQINKTPLTQIEKEEIDTKYLAIGPQWSQIAVEISLPSSKRTSLMVKNYWTSKKKSADRIPLPLPPQRILVPNRIQCLMSLERILAPDRSQYLMSVQRILNG
ncbi:hypothetical protein G9A89_016848 [Geosiphon pyriformis]|nr:hypothetical protein G9A89_016848 [Geosiphon pyriformis]